MYSVAITRVPLDAQGVYIDTDNKGSVLLSGKVTLNVVDGALRSVTVKQGSKPRTKVTGVALKRVTGLSFPSKRDSLTYSALTR